VRRGSFIKAKSVAVADLAVQAALELISSLRTSASPSEGNPEEGMRRTGENQFYVPAHLNSLMWSEANSETRRKFADAVAREVLDHCSPGVRDAILKRWLTDTQRKRFRHEQPPPPQSPSENGDLHFNEASSQPFESEGHDTLPPETRAIDQARHEGGCVMGHNGGGGSYRTTRELKMAAFDRLPADVRQALANAARVHARPSIRVSSQPSVTTKRNLSSGHPDIVITLVGQLIR
jgi:hypothetical protein